MSLIDKGMAKVVVHIGLGKTGTTSLQSQVFPLLRQCGLIDSYNDTTILALAAKHHLVGLTPDELLAFKRRLGEIGTVFISNESLSSWDPAGWQISCERNLQLFGRDATIIITFREPLSYLTSVYLQYVQEGNVKAPEQFFVSDIAYNKLKPVLPHFHEAVFAIEGFDLERFERMYRDAFASVVCATMEEIQALEFLREIYRPNEEKLGALHQAMRQVGRQNVSYSSMAVKLTFARERFLRAFGVKSIGTTDFDIERVEHVVRAPAAAAEPDFDGVADRRLAQRRGVMTFLLNRMKWTWLMQRIVDRLLPYRRYELPAGIVPQNVLEKNLAYYKRLAGRSSI